MIKKYQMKIEEIDAHLEKHLPASAAGITVPNLCTIYAAVRPVLEFAKALLFFKPKWQKAIDQFIASLDANCNGQ